VVLGVGGGLAKRNLYFRSPWKTTTVLEKFKEVYLGMRGDIVLKMMVDQA
jgi:hypothetical protein